MDNELYLPRVESATQGFIWIPWTLLDVMNMSDLRRLIYRVHDETTLDVSNGQG